MKLFAACAFGIEAILKRELLALGYDAKVEQPGRVAFEGDWDAVCRTNLWLRTADRVLVEVQKFDAPDFDALFETIKQFDWSQFIPKNAAFPVTGRSRKSTLTSVPAIQRSTKRAIVESLKHFHHAIELPETGPLYKIDVALLDDIATLTLDTTGPSLHKRGYRTLAAQAPLKETLAAALVDLSVWNPERPLIDPFCGSGTIPIEAALKGLNIAPGINRSFSCSQWDNIDSPHWNQATEEANDLARRDVKLQIIGTDIDKDVLSLARYHSRQASVADQIHFQNKPFEALQSKRQYGCIVTNPPYGERLEDQKSLVGLYQSIPEIVQRLPTWSLYLITNMPRFESMIQKTATRRRKLFNGPLECTYYQFLGPRPPKNFQPADQDLLSSQDAEDAKKPSLQPSKTREKTLPIFGGLQSKDREQADLFRSRLVKRSKHLRRWPTKRGITCFRIYERDIPEIPLVVDRYEDHLHITEYDRPHDRDLARHSAWLELMKETAADALGIAGDNVYLKRRIKTRENPQYEKVGSLGELITINEGGLKFLVNLSDYVDTGLFLDHRITRQMVRDQSAGKHFLNLFAYTGSFSVYAAAGGALSTTTVDLSKNYLHWAKQNFAANDLTHPTNRFIASDSIDFLRSAIKDPEQRFDLAVVDPPTYSNSKRTETDWDVQTRHVELLKLVHQVLRPGGVVFFSTNFRRFKLDLTALYQFECREISKQTVPEDYRNRRIHRCWRMIAK